ncbi:MAG TPA: hypothetical protein VM694_26960, partial [Polyangium sp.]|nr:hypothetical protein [Polyangium sp.]
STLQSGRLCRDARRAAVRVAALRLDATDGQHRLAPDAQHVAPHREGRQATVGETQATGADEHDLVLQPGTDERVVDTREPAQERQRDVIAVGKGSTFAFAIPLAGAMGR